MLVSSREHYRRQSRLTQLAVAEAARRRTRGAAAMASTIATYQLASVTLALQFTPAELDEQGLQAPPEGQVAPERLLTAVPATTQMLSRAASDAAVDRLVAALVSDAGRTASTVDFARRPAVTGYVRALNPPSCGRCAVLAGRVYRWSTGFQRHPKCDCVMSPTTAEIGPDLIVDPDVLVARGQIRGLSATDKQALDLGADLGQVVNVRRRRAGLQVGSSVVSRGGRPTPQGVLARADGDRAAALAGLREHGYLI